MKHQKYPQDKKVVAQSVANGNANQTGSDFTPCPEEVARHAYFTYMNEGAPEGRDVQHWLETEARLIKEREITRIHASHNRT